MAQGVLSIVLDFRLGPVRAGIEFLMPDAVGRLIFDADGLARHFLLTGRGPRRCDRRVMAWKRLRERAAGFVGPAILCLTIL